MSENEKKNENEMDRNDSESWEYALSVPNDLRAVTVSRRTLRLILTLHGQIGLVDTAELMAAELMANAVGHSRSPADLRVSWSAGALRIGAWDADPEPPRPPDPFHPDPPGELETGRGLAIVGACADLWGWRTAARGCHNSERCDSTHGNGKYVWCELRTARMPALGYRP